MIFEIPQQKEIQLNPVVHKAKELEEARVLLAKYGIAIDDDTEAINNQSRSSSVILFGDKAKSWAGSDGSNKLETKVTGKDAIYAHPPQAHPAHLKTPLD